MTGPSAIYKSSLIKTFDTTNITELTTNGKTTGPSEYVIKAGIVDKDRPSDAKDTYLGRLRAQMTYLQDEINEFLTTEMQKEKDVGEKEFESKVLDGGDENSDSD